MRIHQIKPICLFLFSLLIASQPALAQENGAAKRERLPLWKIENRTNSVYLLGSVHFLNETNYPLPTPIESAFSNAQVVVFETDVGAMTQIDTQMKMLTKGRLPEGQALKDQLSAETYTQLMEYAAKSGLPEPVFTQLKPVMAVVTLLSVDLLKMGLQPEHGLDQHFYKLADERGKKTVPLETIDFQIDLLTSFSKEEGELMVKSMLKEIDNVHKTLGDIVRAWQTGDAKALGQLLNDAMDDSPVIMKRMLTDRNERWVPKIQELADSGKNVIVIVGAGHLVGDAGVVELLKKKGLKVTQQ